MRQVYGKTCFYLHQFSAQFMVNLIIQCAQSVRIIVRMVESEEPIHVFRLK